MSINIGIIGSTGYAGSQLVWLLAKHKKVNIVFLSSHSYEEINFSDVYPQFENHIPLKCINFDEVYNNLSNLDVLFIALPHGKSFDIVRKSLELGIKVIDLGADFRLDDKSVYEDWYDMSHGAPDIIKESVYGLPEIYREEIKKASLIANPGRYPTASILALAPLLKNKLIDINTLIIDVKSGISGAGRSLSIPILYAEANETMKAYSIGMHRHTPEIEQVLSFIADENVTLTFTPHLVPMNRGILATCYASLSAQLNCEDIVSLYKEFYSNEPFIRVRNILPETRWVKGSNYCDIGISIDSRTNRVIVVSIIDNLLKGAAGQAVQNMNIINGFDEYEGLDLISMLP